MNDDHYSLVTTSSLPPSGDLSHGWGIIAARLILSGIAERLRDDDDPAWRIVARAEFHLGHVFDKEFGSL